MAQAPRRKVVRKPREKYDLNALIAEYQVAMEENKVTIAKLGEAHKKLVSALKDSGLQGYY